MELHCTKLAHENIIICNDTKYIPEEEPLTWHDDWFWIYLGIYTGLVIFAGITSGLTMGLLSLDLTSLKVLEEGGKKSDRKYAKRILPLVKRHHLLLVTLLLANAAAVESMPIFLDKITDPIIAVAVSVSAVLLFGEVVPQAVCTRYGLAIGAMMAPLVYVLMGLVFIVAWPISKVLDCVLGDEHGTFFRRAELGALVDLHRGNSVSDEDPLTKEEVSIIKGALDMKDKEVKDAFVPIEKVFMVNIQQIMNRVRMKQILAKGHSRVPVFDDNKIHGVLLVKSLIEVDPNTTFTMEEIFKQYGRPLPLVPCNMPLYDLLNDMQTGRCHMAAVTVEAELSEDIEVKRDVKSIEKKDILGIITLEDILEQLLQEQILDETDVFVDVRTATKFARSAIRRASLLGGRRASVMLGRRASVVGVREYKRPSGLPTFSNGPSLSSSPARPSPLDDRERRVTVHTMPQGQGPWIQGPGMLGPGPMNPGTGRKKGVYGMPNPQSINDAIINADIDDRSTGDMEPLLE